MKRIFITFIALSLFINPILSCYAVNDSVSSPSAVQKKEQEIDYTLPYPGLLPDNPLYSLKAARDNLVGLLISDPKKKAEFDLLQADKRLQAGVLLIDKSKKYDLAQQTISKGENYFDEAIFKIEQAKTQGMDTVDIKSKMQKAALKHRLVLSQLLKSVPKENKAGYSILLKRMENIIKAVNKLK